MYFVHMPDVYSAVTNTTAGIEDIVADIVASFRQMLVQYFNSVITSCGNAVLFSIW